MQRGKNKTIKYQYLNLSCRNKKINYKVKYVLNNDLEVTGLMQVSNHNCFLNMMSELFEANQDKKLLEIKGYLIYA